MSGLFGSLLVVVLVLVAIWVGLLLVLMSLIAVWFLCLEPLYRQAKAWRRRKAMRIA